MLSIFFVVLFSLAPLSHALAAEKQICQSIDGGEQYCWTAHTVDPPPPVCNDNDLCTDDTVVDGACVFTPKTCPRGTSCNVTTGECEAPPPPPCDDGNLCTIDVVDSANICTHTPKTCPDGGSCNATTGECELPPPPPIPDTGVSDAPTVPKNKRIIIVALDGSGDYQSATAAVDKILPGDTLQFKEGTYTEVINVYRSGSREEPVTFQPYPGHKPIIKSLLRLSGAWYIVEGFEIANSHDGILIAGATSATAKHITIRNNYIHDHGFQGIMMSSVPHVLIENNTFERNGLGPGDCTSTLWNGKNYSHCHGIYVSDSTYCANPAGITIRKNKFIGNSGSGVQFYSNCGKIMQPLVENNLFFNNAIGMYVWHTEGATIRNNTIVQLSYASPQKSALSFLGIYGSRASTIANNLFYSTVPGYPSDAVHYPLHIWGNATGQQTYINNRYYVDPTTNWIWGNVLAGNFLQTYVTKTTDTTSALEAVGAAIENKAGLVDMTNGNFHLLATSPLKGAGNSAHCPKTDFDGNLRPAGQPCSIGAYE